MANINCIEPAGCVAINACAAGVVRSWRWAASVSVGVIGSAVASAMWLWGGDRLNA